MPGAVNEGRRGEGSFTARSFSPVAAEDQPVGGVASGLPRGEGDRVPTDRTLPSAKATFMPPVWAVCVRAGSQSFCQLGRTRNIGAAVYLIRAAASRTF